MKPCLIFLALAAGVLGLSAAVPAHEPGSFNKGSRSPPQPLVTELYVNARPYSGTLASHNPLVRNTRGEPSRLYIVAVQPGRQYTLGVATTSLSQRMSVHLFDRWPHEPNARRIDLPMGPAVKTNPRGIRYRWRLGISSKSPGNLLYIGVTPARSAVFKKKRQPYRIFITTPAIKPGATAGRGITYLQGPRGLELADFPIPSAWVVARPRPRKQLSLLPPEELRGDIIQNGGFQNGLSGWQAHKNYSVSRDVNSFSLQDDGLKIWSLRNSAREGVLQVLNAEVSDARELILSADVRVDKQSLAGTGPEGSDAPVAIAVCYEDVQGSDHCGSRIFWQGFYVLEPTALHPVANGQKVPQGLWYRFQIDMMQLHPKPKFIKYISLEGSGWPEREGWFKEVHLTKKGRR